MTNRERFQTVIDGGTPDRIPAVLRLDPWYNARVAEGNLPDELKGMSLAQVENHVGFGQSARKGVVFREHFADHISTQEFQDGDIFIKQWHAPSGVLTMKSRWLRGDREAGLRPTIIEYPVKSRENYAVFKEIFSNIQYTPTYQDYVNYDHEIGNDGLPFVILGPIPIHNLMLLWAGYENAYMHLFDFPDVVLDAVETANKTYRDMWDVVARSPARFVMHGVNFDAATTPPNIFRQHFVPYLTEFVGIMHKAGKKVAFHADGNLAGLLELLVDIGYDVADCFACSPLVECTAEQARRIWRDRITIWGGIPSNMLDADTPIDKLKAHLQKLYQAMAPGKNFILGISDQALPTARWEHIKTISTWHQQYGQYSITGLS